MRTPDQRIPGFNRITIGVEFELRTAKFGGVPHDAFILFLRIFSNLEMDHQITKTKAPEQTGNSTDLIYVILTW